MMSRQRVGSLTALKGLPTGERSASEALALQPCNIFRQHAAVIFRNPADDLVLMPERRSTGKHARKRREPAIGGHRKNLTPRQPVGNPVGELVIGAQHV